MNSAATTNMKPSPRPERSAMSESGSTAGSRMRRASASARQAEDAADLDELAVDRQDRAGDAEIDREEHADRDQRHLRGLEDAEPQDEQRHPGDGGDGAQRLQGRIEQPAGASAIAPESAPSRMPAAAPSAKPAATRHSVAQTCVQSSPVAASASERRDDPARRRHQAALGEAEAHGGLPAERERRAAGRSREATRQLEAARRFAGAAAGGRESGGALEGEAGQACRLASHGALPRRSFSRDAVAIAADRSSVVDRGLHVDARPACTPASCKARPAARIVSPCGWPMVECVSSVRSSWRSITGVGQLGVARRGSSSARPGWRAT